MNRQTTSNKPSALSYSLRDIAFIALTGVFCGAIFFGTSLSYNFLAAGMAAIGLGPFANDVLLGLWMIAGPLAAMLTQKIGASTIGELLGSFVEMILGGQWGAATLISGLIQGVGNGLGFAMTGYKRFDKLGLLLSTITGTLVTFGWSMINEGYGKYNFGFILLLLLVRFISIGFFAGVLVYWINKLVEKSGILNRD
ncbi:ECF transporter S component [Companilactobacillus zhongbaensis]|uniref:ECF transporter S component n=1 Tax=Companilactobacillus zhongbaensis TaxID=2486009 RepID=UPI000F784ED4|nr:ECF transporter S component [Companilactobacillus zhongbaensis]